MTATPTQTDLQQAELHAREAERLLKSQFIWSSVKAGAHAALALYYATRRSETAS